METSFSDAGAVNCKPINRNPCYGANYYFRTEDKYTVKNDLKYNKFFSKSF